MAEEINNYFIGVGDNLARRFHKAEDIQKIHTWSSLTIRHDLTEITVLYQKKTTL